MKIIVTAVLATCLTACGTIGGATIGAGQDLQNLGTWILTK